MSLPTDIIQLFGAGSVPVIVGGSVLGVFELGERLTSQRAKDDLSGWLLTFDVQKSKTLPDGTQELFDRIFGERHFSWKCFIRSAAFSLGAMAFIGILVFLIDPKVAFEMITKISVFAEGEAGNRYYGQWLPLTLWLLWSIPIDYISLLKTRLILRAVARRHRRNNIVAVPILCIDFVVYKLLFTFGVLLIGLTSVLIAGLTIFNWFHALIVIYEWTMSLSESLSEMITSLPWIKDELVLFSFGQVLRLLFGCGCMYLLCL